MKVGGFLKGQHQELLYTMEKMSLFNGSQDGPDQGSEEDSSSAFCNLDNTLNAESKRKPAARREDQREGKSKCTATGTVASPTKKETLTTAEEILKTRVTAPSFKMMLPFPNFQAAISLMRRMRIFQNLHWRNVLHFTVWMTIAISYYYQLLLWKVQILVRRCCTPSYKNTSLTVQSS